MWCSTLFKVSSCTIFLLNTECKCVSVYITHLLSNSVTYCPLQTSSLLVVKNYHIACLRQILSWTKLISRCVCCAYQYSSGSLRFSWTYSSTAPPAAMNASQIRVTDETYSHSKSSSSNAGTVAGIVVGIVAAILIILTAVYYNSRRKVRKHRLLYQQEVYF